MEEVLCQGKAALEDVNLRKERYRWPRSKRSFDLGYRLNHVYVEVLVNLLLKWDWGLSRWQLSNVTCCVGLLGRKRYPRL